MRHREGKACCGDTVRAVLGCSLHQPWLVLEVVRPWWEGRQGDPHGPWEGTARPRDPMGRSLLWGLSRRDSVVPSLGRSERDPTAGSPQPRCYPHVVSPTARVPSGKKKIRSPLGIL